MGIRQTREEIVKAADQLFYRQGYAHTSFSDIADAVQISRGNFYYHFKSKDEILDAVIELRQVERQEMLRQWEQKAGDPEECIRSFIHLLVANRANIKRYGCPVGTLCAELGKLNHASQAEANELFTLFRTWLRKQFAALGRQSDADDLAMQVLAWSQGVAALSSAFRDEQFIKKEVRRLDNWLTTVAQCDSQ
jgi:TetR/AcrR family transcriptional repressor of nem operon